ncbi:hypothetical protein BC941DRAFT_420515 [Chlamydoabsidia padenii]|nr:hypothetical protein BC941DRAFT_420515 [Chlamydoabsidia padenii]
MTCKNGLETKETKTCNISKDDGNFANTNDWIPSTTISAPRQKRTDTQALVDFLNTTSPEDFQKTTTTPTTKIALHKLVTTNATRRIVSASSFLWRRNKSKSFSSSSTFSTPSTTSTQSDDSSFASSYHKHAPNTIQRKNYIEIIAHSAVKRGPGDLGAVGKLSLNESDLVTGNGSFKSPYSNFNIGGMTDSKSLLTSDTPSPCRISLPSTRKPENTKDGHHLDHENKTYSWDTMDVVEAGLIQRLMQCQLDGINKSRHGVGQHVNPSPLADQNYSKTKRRRHAQVQTLASVHQEANSLPSSTSHITPLCKDNTGSTATFMNSKVIELQQQLKQERQDCQQLESTIKATYDHFEILGELAYKKLQELLEEKMWLESACLDLRNSLVKTELGHNMA